MKNDHRWNRALHALLALPLLCGACGGGEPAERDASAAAKPQGAASAETLGVSTAGVEALGLEAAAAEPRRIHQEIRANAVIKPNENRLAHVSPRIAGKAARVDSVLGDIVVEGQALALLDSLELGEKKSIFLQARAGFEVARRGYERESRLFERQVSSEKDYLAAKGELERSEAAYRASREALRLLGLTDARIDGTRWGGKGQPLSYFPLLAPFSGTVIDQHLTLGELVRPEDLPYTIADLSTLWIQLDIYEKDLAKVRRGAAVEVRVEAFPGATFRGHVAYLSDRVDEQTRTLRARVEVENREGKLRPGMFATALLELFQESADPVLAIPETAIQRVRGKPVAFVESAPGSYTARPLELGSEGAGWVEVKSGVSKGERVVTHGAFALKATLLKDELAGDD